jgi:copper chaperone CopZ
MEKVELKEFVVENITCNLCVKIISKYISAISEIQEIIPDYNKKIAKVILKHPKSKEEIKRVLEEASKCTFGFHNYKLLEN